jgi:hypothetical protein
VVIVEVAGDTAVLVDTGAVVHGVEDAVVGIAEDGVDITVEDVRPIPEHRHTRVTVAGLRTVDPDAPEIVSPWNPRGEILSKNSCAIYSSFCTK